MVWNINFIFPEILGMSSSQLTFIFFRGVAQPPTSDHICRWCPEMLRLGKGISKGRFDWLPEASGKHPQLHPVSFSTYPSSEGKLSHFCLFCKQKKTTWGFAFMGVPLVIIHCRLGCSPLKTSHFGVPPWPWKPLHAIWMASKAATTSWVKVWCWTSPIPSRPLLPSTN